MIVQLPVHPSYYPTGSAPPKLVPWSVDPPLAKTLTAGQPVTVQGSNMLNTTIEIGQGGVWTPFSATSSSRTAAQGLAPSVAAGVYDFRARNTLTGAVDVLPAAFAVDSWLWLLDSSVAASLVPGAGGIETWLDILVGGWLGDVTQAVGGAQPADTPNAIGGRHALLFGGAQFLQKTGLVDQAQPLFIDIVGQQQGPILSTYGLWDGSSGIISAEAQYANGQVGFYAGATVQAAADTITNPFQLNVTYDGVSSASRFNRAPLAAGDPGALALQSGLTVGAVHSGAAAFVGLIASMVGLAGVPSPTVLNILEQWRKWKWSLQ